MPQTQRHRVAKVTDIPPGSRKIVEIAGRSIGIFNVSGRFFAVKNSCPHQGGPLCLGPTIGLVTSSAPGDFQYERDGEILRCPWHGWEFDLATGHSVVDPNGIRVKSYPVELEPESDVESASEPEFLVAVTYPVEIEQETVVVVLA